MAGKNSQSSALIAVGATTLVALVLLFALSQDWDHGRNRIIDRAQAQFADAHGQYDYALRLEKFGGPEGAGKAMQWLETSADRGYAPAMLALGDRYDVEPDEASGDAAVKWYEKAAKTGNPEATRKLGIAYDLGRGTLPPSPVLARTYFEKAAKAGDLPATTLYGRALLRENNLKDGETWLIKAADRGDVDAYVALGNLYYAYYSPMKDMTKAAKYYGLAAEAGRSEIMVNYAFMLLNGMGVKEDMAEAYKWVLIASVARQREMQYPLATIRTYMTPEQLLDGEQRAAAWKKTHPKVQK